MDLGGGNFGSPNGGFGENTNGFGENPNGNMGQNGYNNIDLSGDSINLSKDNNNMNGYGMGNGLGNGMGMGGNFGGPNNGMGNPYGMNNNGMNPNNMGNGGKDPNTDITIWTVLGIIQIILVCCCNFTTFITGIITMVFISKAKTALYTSDVQSFTSYVKSAKIANLIGWGLMILNILLNVVLGTFSFVFDKL